MKKLVFLIVLIALYDNLYCQDKEYYFRKSDSILLSQCSMKFYELLMENREYSYQHNIDWSDLFDLKRANDSAYMEKFKKDFHFVTFGSLKVFDKLINVKTDCSSFSSRLLRLVFVEDTLTDIFGEIPDFKALEIAYNRLFESTMISEDSAKKIIEPRLTLTPYLETDYSILYDIMNDRIIWSASRTKQANGGRNEYSGRAYLTCDGKIVVESIELNVETGMIMKHEIQECVLKIR